MTKDIYTNPLTTRYTSKEMSFLFSPQVKFETWRTLWIALAESEMELGLPITTEQIEEMKKYEHDINFEEAEAREKIVRHDVMSHVYAFGLQAKSAAPIIHLGATSAYVGDNTDIIVMRRALVLIQEKLAYLIKALSEFAMEYRSLPTLGFTHFQPAQLTTVGKRASLWMQDFYLDYLEVERVANSLPLRGVKGTTGTQASFLELFDGDSDKVKQLEKKVCEKLGIKEVVSLSGQTYTRKLDYQVLAVLSGIAQSASKMANDIRLLQHLKEIEEPFEKEQIGSSAMAYKRNPMRTERVCSLARYVMSTPAVAAATEATQWFERTLDDSACRRIVIPETFMAADAIIDILRNVSSGLVVHEKVIESRIMSELPFMTTENIMMEAVKKGGNRQDLHELIRTHSQEAARVVKDEGKPNDLMSRIASDSEFGLNDDELSELLDPKLYTGMSAVQVEDFVNECIAPITSDLKESNDIELKV